jgi:hypothetical protein
MAPPRPRSNKLPASWVPNLEELVTKEERKRNKYGAIKTTYNGRTYDSKLEASVSQMLDTLRSATNASERVIHVQYQVPYVLDPKQGKERAVKYYADFVVIFGAGPHVRLRVIEVKGRETSTWRLKYRLFRTKFPELDLRVVKTTAEVIAIAQEKTVQTTLSIGHGH